MARCMLVGAGIDESLWAEAVDTAAYLRSRAPTKALENDTPYKIWYGNKPKVAHLRTFGSTAIALDKRERSKFKPRGKEYVMVGYSNTSKAYRLFDKETSRLIVSRDVYFCEVSAYKEHVSFEVQVAEAADQTPVLKTDIAVGDEDELRGEDTSSSESSDDDKLDISEGEFQSAEEESANFEAKARGPRRPQIVRTGNRGRSKRSNN